MDAATGPAATFDANVTDLPDISPQTTLSLIASAADVAVIMGRDGIVRALAVGEPDLPRATFDGWIGKRFLDTVTVESRPKVERLLSVSGDGTISAPAHVNHPQSGAEDLPVRYSAAVLGPDTLIAVGRDLSPLALAQRRLLTAQRNAEREQLRLRSAEARYRQYFRVADEPVVIIEANDRVGDANQAAKHAWPHLSALTGRRAADLVPPAERPTLAALLAAARETNAPREVSLGGSRVVAVPLRRSENAIILRFVDGTSDGPLNAAERLARIVEAMPDAFVVTDAAYTIIAANPAFVTMTETAGLREVLGSPIDAWLGRPGVDLSVIRSALNEHGSIRGYSTVIQGELGQIQEVELSAALAGDPHAEFIGLSIRESAGHEAMLAPRSAQQVADLVGRVPIKEIVRETTDTIERMCIEAALELSGDNRASAAELLGLSRQSLYVKMRRYGIVDVDPEAGAANDT